MCTALTHRRTAMPALEHFNPARPRNRVQFVPARSLVMNNLAMVNLFSAGQELVRWGVTAISDEGPYPLRVVYPTRGTLGELSHRAGGASRERRAREKLPRRRRHLPTRGHV